MRSLGTILLEKESMSSLKHRFKEKYNSLYNKVGHFFKPQHKYLLISQCGDSKNENSHKDKVYAREMYMGPANQYLLKNITDLNVDWLICSGGYGLLSSNSKINYYTDVVMQLNKTTLQDLKDFCRYEEDLIKIIKAGNYSKILFTVGDVWQQMFDFNKIAEVAGENCEIYFFPPGADFNNEWAKNIRPVKYKKSMLAQFGAIKFCIKEVVFAEYLKYIIKNSDININTFIKNFKKSDKKDQNNDN